MTRPAWSLGFFSNPLLWAGVAVMTLLQMFYTYLPIFNTLFQSAPMGMTGWALVLGNSLLIYVVVEIEKRMHRRTVSKD
jgi:Ca2+-transporting ATPase